MDTSLYSRDQVQLPGPALHLPDAQRQEPAEPQQRQDREKPALGSGQEPMPGSLIGIMFVLRWNMIHSEPEITISTITAANA